LSRDRRQQSEGSLSNLTADSLVPLFEFRTMDAMLETFCGSSRAEVSFTAQVSPMHASGYFPGKLQVGSNYEGRLHFPELAAGGEATIRALGDFLAALVNAYGQKVDLGNGLDTGTKLLAPGSTDSTGREFDILSELVSSANFGKKYASLSDGIHYWGDPARGIHHDTACHMLHADPRDVTSVATKGFMNAYLGTGLFVAHAGPNLVACHQAANEGFRGLYMVCFRGPDAGKGVVCVSNGDDDAVFLNCDVVLAILALERWRGVEFSTDDPSALREDQYLGGDSVKATASTNSTSEIAKASGHTGIQSNAGDQTKAIPKEQRVNVAMRDRLFSRLQQSLAPMLPQELLRTAPLEPFSEFNRLWVLGQSPPTVLAVSSDEFARASNLLLHAVPVFDPHAFGQSGKLMDSWESKRHNRREGGYDFLRFSVEEISDVDIVSVSTKYHDGNHGEFVGVYECIFDESVSTAEPASFRPVVPGPTQLNGHSLHWYRLGKDFQIVSSGKRVRRIFEIRNYPDGGISRLAFYREADIIAALRSRATASTDDTHELFPEHEKFRAFLESSSASTILRYRCSFGPPVEKSKPAHPMDSSAPAPSSAADLPGRPAPALLNRACGAAGAQVVSASNEHYGPASCVLDALRPLGMFHGFETKRSRGGHHEEVVVKLAAPGGGGSSSLPAARLVLLDFSHFVNNSPHEVEVWGGGTGCEESGIWPRLLVPRTWVKPYAANVWYTLLDTSVGQFSHVRVMVWPDGGINRIVVV